MKKNILPYYAELHALAASILKCREDIVDDILQETYIEIYEKYRMPLDLYSKEVLVNICKTRCRKAYSEMMKSPSKPMRKISVSGEDMDVDLYLDISTYRKTVYQDNFFEVDFKEIDSIKDRTEWKGLHHFLTQNYSEEQPQEPIKKQIRYSNKEIFERVKHTWRTKRTKYLDSLIQNATAFRENAELYNNIFLEYLKIKQWGNANKPICPCCGCNKIYILRIKNGGNAYRCAEKGCCKRFSPISATIFNNNKLPLAIWFYLIKAYVNNGYNKLNTIHSAKVTAISQTTSWHLLQKIYQSIVRVSDNEFTMNGISNSFTINEIDELLNKCTSSVETIPTINWNRGKKIACIDKMGNTTVFDNLTIAGKELGMDYRRIGEYINGKRKYNNSGYKFTLCQ